MPVVFFGRGGRITRCTRDPAVGGVAQDNPKTGYACCLFCFTGLSAKRHYAYKTKNPITKVIGFFWSGWQDSNLRPPRPKRGAITGLRYTPKN